MITGEFIDVIHESLSKQMEIENIIFTKDNILLVWSASHYYLYDLQGKLLVRGAETVSGAEKVTMDLLNSFASLH